MTSRALHYYGSDILRKRSREVDLSSERDYIESLVADMIAILSMENGLGLAAPQTGENVRLFILDPQELGLNGHGIFINPIVETSGLPLKDEEGCLSIPGIFEMVKRPARVVITATDISGSTFTLELEDYAARAIQHEFDHINGVLFVDRLSPVRKRLIRKRLADIKKEYRSGNRIL